MKFYAIDDWSRFFNKRDKRIISVASSDKSPP